MFHLDLTSCWTWAAITSGFQHLSQLTHLSLNWNITCASTDGLHKLLACEHFGMIVLWRDEQEGHNLVVRNLIKCGLDDPQIVVLHRASRLSLMIYRGF